ncbi:hypothetical protein HYC85_029162 [Camellia sinensis]|uniref:DUF7803 domain-containing protein n=1 Tax=Camellia sinensis TaxID=4442 RepID=A0A7J7FYE8_CAMSI|nr:hypothetical protein HYC85_029162 [Camellia sinensis]
MRKGAILMVGVQRSESNGYQNFDPDLTIHLGTIDSDHWKVFFVIELIFLTFFFDEMQNFYHRIFYCIIFYLHFTMSIVFFIISSLLFIDSQPMMEETILVGDDLMMGPPSPLIPAEIASHVLEGVDLCDGILRNLFLCLQINDIEPFCQDEIALYRQCAEKRDKELRERLQDSERKLGSTMPLDEANERAAQLESEVTSLDRRLILASGIEGMDGFRQRWSLHGRLTDTKRRLEALKMGMEKRKKDEPVVGVVGASLFCQSMRTAMAVWFGKPRLLLSRLWRKLQIVSPPCNGGAVDFSNHPYKFTLT